MSTRGADLRVERVVTTSALGKRIRRFALLEERYDGYLPPLTAGAELPVASSDASLQFGDISPIQGRPASIDAAATVGATRSKTQQQMLLVFIGTD